MRAPCLRAGMVWLGVAVFTGALLLGGTPAFAADDDLKDALKDYAAGRYEEALGKLRAYVASNPGEDEVYAVLRDVDEKVLLRVLAKEGEHEDLMKYLLDKARPETGERRIDPDEIEELVETAVNDDRLDKRRRAGMRLISAGALAVPYFYLYLARSDAEVVVNTMLALHRLGSSAVPPLVAVLDSDDARMRGNAAVVLGDLRAVAAVPALLRMAEGDEDEAAQMKASKALRKIAESKTLPKSAANAFWSLGERFYANDPIVAMDFGDRRSLWRWTDGELARFEVPAYLYGSQMAEQMAYDALALNPAHMGARSLLVRSLLAQKVEADVVAADGGEAPEALAGAFTLAETQGFDAATEALRDSLRARDWDVAIEAMQLCAAVHADESLARHPLGAALIAPERRVKYEAAIAALHMSPKGLPNADKVAFLAASAASEETVRQVLVIDDRAPTRNRILMDLAHSGFVAGHAANGALGVTRAKSAPTLDVVIVRADLGDPDTTIPSRRHYSSLTVIDELKSDVRTKDVRIIVLIEDTLESKVDAVKDFFDNKYSDTIAGYITVPIDTVTAIDIVTEAAAAGDLSPGQARAQDLAERAALAFASTDFTCSTFNLKIAVDPLATAALEGQPPVRMAAVKALGNIRKGGAEALMQVLTSDGDDELRAAAASALGRVLAVTGGTDEQIEALIEATKGDGPVAEAALEAVGQVKGLTPDQRRGLFEAHRLPVAEATGS